MTILNLSLNKEEQIKKALTDIEVSKYRPLKYQFPQFDSYPLPTSTLCHGDDLLYYEFKEKWDDIVPEKQTICIGLDYKKLPRIYMQFYTLPNNDVILKLYGYPVVYQAPLETVCFNTKKRPLEEKDNLIWESCNNLYSKYIDSPKHMFIESINLIKRLDFFNLDAIAEEA